MDDEHLLDDPQESIGETSGCAQQETVDLPRWSYKLVPEEYSL